MVDVASVLADGQTLTVADGVADIVRKLREGDPIIGWEGDPNMRVMVDLERGLFDVWTFDEASGEPWLCIGERPYCDERLILDVIHADNRRFPLVERLKERTKARERQEAWERSERIGEVADKLHFALLKDIGHLEGGTRRNLLHTHTVVRPNRAQRRAAARGGN